MLAALASTEKAAMKDRSIMQPHEFVELGKKAGVPTLIDAAAEIPPPETLTRFTKMEQYVPTGSVSCSSGVSPHSFPWLTSLHQRSAGHRRVSDRGSLAHRAAAWGRAPILPSVAGLYSTNIRDSLGLYTVGGKRMAIEVQTSPQGTIPYPARRSFGKIPAVLEMPHLVQIQLDSFHWFLDEGIQELLDEISPITDFTGKSMELSFPRDPVTNRSFEFGEARFTEAECRERDMTYSAPLRVRTRLLIKETGEIKESEIFLGRLPDDDAQTAPSSSTARSASSSRSLSARRASTSPRTEDPSTGRRLYRGEADPEPRRMAGVRDLQPRHPLGQGRPQAQDAGDDPAARPRLRHRRATPRALQGDRREPEQHRYIAATLDKEPMKSTTDEKKGRDQALLELYKRIRPGDPPTRENAENLLKNLFFFARRYDLAKVGRYKLNKRLSLDPSNETRVLTNEDIITDRHDDDQAEQRRGRAGRHRPPRQPPHPRGRRVDPDAGARRPGAHGARRQGAHDDPGPGDGDAERADQHPPGHGGGARVLRRVAALAVHGPDQPAGRADATSAASPRSAPVA